MLADRFCLFGVWGDSDFDRHGSDMDAFLVETLEQAQRHGPDTGLADAQRNVVWIWRQR